MKKVTARTLMIKECARLEEEYDNKIEALKQERIDVLYNLKIKFMQEHLPIQSGDVVTLYCDYPMVPQIRINGKINKEMVEKYHQENAIKVKIACINVYDVGCYVTFYKWSKKTKNFLKHCSGEFVYAIEKNNILYMCSDYPRLDENDNRFNANDRREYNKTIAKILGKQILPLCEEFEDFC